MPLSAKEMKKLQELTEKKDASDPIKERDIEVMEKRIADNYHRMPEVMVSIMRPWNKYCEWLQELASDNSALVSEIRRLKSVLKEKNALLTKKDKSEES